MAQRKSEMLKHIDAVGYKQPAAYLKGKQNARQNI